MIQPKTKTPLIAGIAATGAAVLAIVGGLHGAKTPAGTVPPVPSHVTTPVMAAGAGDPTPAPNSNGAPYYLPNPALTPGDVSDVSQVDVCTPGYTSKVRNVPESVKRQVYAEYGYNPAAHPSCEVDHLISLELGGSNSIRNLWPMPYAGKWNARVKDRLENKLHSLVCSGAITLQQSQAAIKGDWTIYYKKYVGPEPKESPVPVE